MVGLDLVFKCCLCRDRNWY